MAYNEQKIDPIDFEKNTAVGFKLPLSSNAGGGFLLNYDTLSQAKTNLKNLLLTTKGERYMQPNFGTNLKKIVFEQNTEEIEEIIEDDIKGVVNFWLPYITIKDLKINRFEHTIRIFVEFIINNNEFNRDSITLTVETVI